MKDKKTQYVITRVYTGEKSIEDVFENIMKYTIKENLYKEKKENENLNVLHKEEQNKNITRKAI